MSDLQIKWYGLNALEIRHSKGVFMIDPYVSRDNVKLHIQEEVDKYFTSGPDFVLMTHSHWDHLADMPCLLRKFRTKLYASRTACNIMRSMGVEEELLYEIHYGERLLLPGDIKVTVYESRHMGREDEAEKYEEVPSDFQKDVKSSWICGETFAFAIEADQKRLLNIGSANVYEKTMKGLSCDYLLCGISRYKEGFPQKLMENITFDTLIPTHHDEFLLKLDQFILRNDMDRLLEELPDLKHMDLQVLQWTVLP